jgi:hypothetical protein
MSNMKREWESQLLEEQEERERQMRSAGLTKETMDKINAYIRKAQEKKND